MMAVMRLCVWMGLLLALAAAGAPGAAARDQTPKLVLERAIPLPGVVGRIDHMAADSGRKRLFVAELGNGSVDVIDLIAGRPIRRLSGLRAPQGVGFAPGADLLAVASAGDGSVRLFRGGDYAPTGVIALGDDADNVRFDAAGARLLIGYGSGGLAAIDPRRAAVTDRIGLAAHPEGFQPDPATGRIFVNVPDADQIAVIDPAAGRQVATWRVPGLRGNFPMALDPAQHAIAVVFRNPPRLVLLDERDGTVAASLATCGDADDVFFDPVRPRIYVSCGEGVVDVLQRAGSGYRRIAALKTKPGARTSLFVPALDRLFVAARAGWFGSGSDAAILVFAPRN